MIEQMNGKVQFCLVELEQIIDLRHAVLRQGLPRDAAIFDGDTGAHALHYGAIDFAGILIGCATLHPSQWDSQPAWQLRGMAVAPDLRNSGIGRDLLDFVERDARTRDPQRILWCNARVPAAPFYQKQGWRIVSEIFEIPTAGPHVKMVKS